MGEAIPRTQSDREKNHPEGVISVYLSTDPVKESTANYVKNVVTDRSRCIGSTGDMNKKARHSDR